MGADGEQPGADNPHNRGGLSAVAVQPRRRRAARPGRRGWWPEGLLHEITHTLGAVQWGAPHSTQPPGSRTRATAIAGRAPTSCATPRTPARPSSCASTARRCQGTIIESYDCGRDDYFNPAPPPGSYLATHWNMYDSAFLARCAEVVPACGGDGTRRHAAAAGRDDGTGDRGQAAAAAPR